MRWMVSMSLTYRVLHFEVYEARQPILEVYGREGYILKWGVVYLWQELRSLNLNGIELYVY